MEQTKLNIFINLQQTLNTLVKTKKVYSLENLLNQSNVGLQNLQIYKIYFQKLCQNRTIIEVKKNLYRRASARKLYVGVLQTKQPTYGFLKLLSKETNLEDIFVEISNQNPVLDGDIMVVSCQRQGNGKLRARVGAVLDRDIRTFVAVIHVFKNRLILVPLNKQLQNIKMNVKNLNKFNSNDYVVCKIGSYKKKILTSIILKKIGSDNIPGDDIRAQLRDLKIKRQFNKNSLKQAEELPNSVSKKDFESRLNLTEENLVTIDGDDAKDFDDAICVKKTKSGYKLIVAIADVSHYVTLNSPLDQEALIRGTSVYTANIVTPMLPVKLSNGLCSLNPNQIRLVVATEIEYDSFGVIINAKISPAVMISKQRLTYRLVNDAFQNKKNAINQLNTGIFSMLKNARELYKLLEAKMLRNNMLDFNSSEIKLRMNSDGSVENVGIKTQKHGESMIEMFMIAANVSVAKYVFELKLPFLYRVHDKPTLKGYQEFYKIIKAFGIKSEYVGYDRFNGSVVKSILDKIKDNPIYPLIVDMLLKTMSKAKYSPDCTGHFGLGLEYYTHFTSPIRRYPDLIVHRYLKEYLLNAKPNKSKITNNTDVIGKAIENSNINEIKAVKAERLIVNMKVAEFMKKYINQNFIGIVVSITNFGFFVKLDNYAEGLIRYSAMPDVYRYDNESLTAKSTNGKTIFLGQKVFIKVTSANKFAREVGFKFLNFK